MDTKLVEHLLGRSLDTIKLLEEKVAAPLHGQNIRKGYYHYIAYPVKQFLDSLIEARECFYAHNKYYPTTFLDVGCGIGTKSHIANWIGLVGHGIDCNLAYINMATELFPRCHFETIDALNYKKYANYDIIYFFRPVGDSELAALLETIIIEQAKPGTVLLWFGAVFREIPKRLQRLNESLYLVTN